MNNSLYTRFNRTMSILLKSIFKNERVYIFCLLLPFVMSSTLYMAYNKFSTHKILPPIIISFNFLSVFITSMFIGILLIDWKNNDFLRRIKLYNINYFMLTLIVYCISIIISISSFSIITLIQIIESKLFTFKLTNVNMLANFSWYIWILILVCVALLSIVTTSVISFIVYITSNKIIASAIVFLVSIFMILFSDIVIIPSISSTIKSFVFIGYLNPARYVIWLSFLFTSYSYIDYEGIYQLVSNLHVDYILSFKSIYIAFLGSACWFVFFELLGWKLIKWGVKG